MWPNEMWPFKFTPTPDYPIILLPATNDYIFDLHGMIDALYRVDFVFKSRCCAR